MNYIPIKIEITSHDRIVVGEGKRRKNRHERLSGDAVLTQSGEPRQLVVRQLVEVVPAEPVDEDQKQFVRWRRRRRRLNETKQHQRCQRGDDEVKRSLRRTLSGTSVQTHRWRQLHQLALDLTELRWTRPTRVVQLAVSKLQQSWYEDRSFALLPGQVLLFHLPPVKAPTPVICRWLTPRSSARGQLPPALVDLVKQKSFRRVVHCVCRGRLTGGSWPRGVSHRGPRGASDWGHFDRGTDNRGHLTRAEWQNNSRQLVLSSANLNEPAPHCSCYYLTILMAWFYTVVHRKMAVNFC